MTKVAKSAEKKSVATIGFLIVFSLLLTALLISTLHPDGDGGLGIILSHSLLVILALVAVVPNLAGPVILALCVRLSILYMDLFTEIAIFASGGDTENFYKTGILIYEDPGAADGQVYGGAYSKFLGWFFQEFGPNRLLAQYVNLIASILGLILVAAALERLVRSSEVRRGVMIVMAVMPIAASISVILLRESLIFMLVALSLYWFCLWLTGGRSVLLLGILGSVLLAAILHVGVLGLLAGYGVVALLFDRTSRRWSIRLSSLVPVGALAIVVALAIMRFPGLFLEKTAGSTDLGDALRLVELASSGGSAYLQGISIDGPIDLVLFGWIKSFYLLTSPLPWDWRALPDVVSFAADGAIYLVAIMLIGRALIRKMPQKRKGELLSLVCALAAFALVLGLGSSATGTAMRHRQKLLPVAGVTVAIAMDLTLNRRSLARGSSGVVLTVDDLASSQSNDGEELEKTS